MRAMRRAWPFLPEVHLFHSRAKARRFMRGHWDTTPKFIDGAGAQTWSCDGTSVVLMTYAGGREAEDALLAHEATHVVQHHFCDYLGEDDIGTEVMAYGVQAVTEALMRAQRKWRRRK